MARHKELGILPLSVLLLLIAFLLFLTFHHFGVSFGDSLKFLAGLLCVVYFPGRSLLWLMRIRVRRLEMAALSLTLGMMTGILVYKLARLLDWEWLFLLWIAGGTGYFVFRMIKNPPRIRDFTFRLTWAGAGLALICLLLFAVLFLDNYRNGIRNPDGSVTVNMHYYDGFIRNAVIREVSHAVPPQMPFAAGFPLSYHYGMDLFTSLFSKLFGLGILDLNHRLMLTFFFALLVLACYVFTREFLASDFGGLLATFLILFGGGGLSYLASIFLGAAPGGNSFHSLYLFDILGINSLLPALAVFFLGLHCLSQYLDARKFVWLLLAAFFLASLLELKVFLVGPVIAAFFVSGLFAFLRSRQTLLFQAGGMTAAFALPVLASALLIGHGGISYSFKLKFMDWIVQMLRRLDVPSLAEAWYAVFYRSDVSFAGIFFCLLAIGLFILGSFGFSWIAWPSMIKNLFFPKKDEGLRLFLIVLSAGAIFYFFFFQISLLRLPRNILNIYVYYLGIIVLILFWTERVTRFLRGKRPFVQCVLVLLLLALSVPSFLLFFRLKIRYPRPQVFPAAFIEAADWVSQNTPPQSVILQPSDLRHIPYFADRRVVLDNSAHSYLPFHLSRKDIRNRTADIDRFFRDPELNGDIPEKYSASLVWVTAADRALGEQRVPSGPVFCYKAVKKAASKHFQKTFRLDLVFQNEGFHIFTVATLPEKAREIYTLHEENGQRILHPLQKQD
jgi:hypothetical protein